VTAVTQDTALLNQIYYNGKVWIGLYYNVYGTEFIIEDRWFRASVVVDGISFDGVEIKYDIYNDDLLANYLGRKIIILNKERVDSFTIHLDDSDLCFSNMDPDQGIKGYYQVIYEGNSQIYKKWRKKRAQFAIEARYDEFQPDNTLLVVIDNRVNEVKNRRHLLNIMSDRKKEIKDFMRHENIRIDLDRAESLIPILEYYDTMHEN